MPLGVASWKIQSDCGFELRLISRAEFFSFSGRVFSFLFWACWLFDNWEYQHGYQDDLNRQGSIMRCCGGLGSRENRVGIIELIASTGKEEEW